MKDERNKTCTISTSLNAKDHEKFEQLAKKEGKRPSEVIREFVKKGCKH